MKSSNIFIEIDGEEIERAFASEPSLIVLLQDVVEVDSGFRSKWPYLLVAACIARNEKNWDSLDLFKG